MIEGLPIELLITEPERALELAPMDAVRLLAQLEGLAAVVRLAAVAKPAALPEANGGLITPVEAARLAGLSVRQLYRRRALRPALVRVGHRTLRVDERKLRRLLAANRP